MPNTKSALRKELLSLRRADISESLCIEDLRRYEEFSRAKVVFCYVSAHGEVKTDKLINQLLKEKEVVVPYCIDSDGNMICSPIKSAEDLRVGRFGIPEPVNPVEFPKEKIDFVIVPGVAFDKEGFRLGYGKGYYDRFLSDINPFKLGVCGKKFYMEKLPHDIYDIKMDDVLVR